MTKTRRILALVFIAIGGAGVLAVGRAQSNGSTRQEESLVYLLARLREVERMETQMEERGTLAVPAGLARDMGREEKELVAGLQQCSAPRCEELSGLRTFYQEALETTWAGRKSRQRDLWIGRWASLAFLALSAALLTAAAPVTPAPQTDAQRDRLYQLQLESWNAQRFAAYGEIVAALSHGLKTPLATIRAQAQLAASRTESDRAEEPLNKIIGQVDGLVEQIKRFLQSSPTGTPVPIPVHPDKLLRPLSDEYQSTARARSLQWHYEVDPDLPEINVDPDLVTMAVRNLVENAFAAAPGQSRVSLSARKTAAPERVGLSQTPPPTHVDSWVEIVISDEGAGIADSVAQGQGASVTSTTGGSGLGLTLARRIVARHGGVLLATAVPDGGTAVRAIFPGGSST